MRTSAQHSTFDLKDTSDYASELPAKLRRPCAENGVCGIWRRGSYEGWSREAGRGASHRGYFDQYILTVSQKLKDMIPDMKQATDKESRNAENGGPPRGFGGRGGRGGRGAFAARGFAAAGLTKSAYSEKRANGDASAAEGSKASEGS